MRHYLTMENIVRKLAILCLAFCLLPASVFANPTTPDQARLVVQGWLARDARPLATIMGQQVTAVQSFQDDQQRTVYFVVYLATAGFVVVPADDLVEPIIAFAPYGLFNPSPDTPLGAMVTRDVPRRVSGAQEAARQAQLEGVPFVPRKSQEKAQQKWQSLASPVGGELGMEAGLPSVSDPRVDPLLQSKWSQTTVDDTPTGNACYNYFTPPNAAGSADNYPCGCPATAGAQLMRYFGFPTIGVGTPSFSIKVDGVARQEALRGGDGKGGAYNWGNMVLVPDSSTTDLQLQAIGALTHDMGAAINTSYSSIAKGGSSANTEDIALALVNTFTYNNAIAGAVPSGTIPLANLIPMINPNLDASLPVLLGVDKTGSTSGHVVVADGYGYNLSTLYHHLNMGWSGSSDAWYNLPNIDLTPPDNYDLVSECVYNVYTSGPNAGEIISGRVLDAKGAPISGATVRATYEFGTFTASTNSRGIYSLSQVKSASTYFMQVSKEGYGFPSRVVTTGTSAHGATPPGNLWGVNFTPAVASPGINELLLFD